MNRIGARDRSGNEAYRWVVWAILFLVMIASAGCGRRIYRLRADREAEQLVREKSTSPDWALCDLNVYQDPRSRYFDPNNPDRPPKPCDDPTAGQIMARIYGPRGMKRWCRDGVTGDIVNPLWISMLPTYSQVLPDGTVVMDLRTANLLARIHNRTYQSNIEEVYLSALDVAFERFRFACQYFGGTDTVFATNGNEATATLGRFQQGSQRSSLSILDQEANFGFSRRFAAGGQFIASIANSMVWQFSGDDVNFSTSLINWSVVQPLLRTGGKIVTLETLTRSERTLLANLRSMAQFEQDFYRDIVIGGGVTVSPARIGGFAGGAGLTGFTGTGAGGFGGVGAGQGFGGFGGNGAGVGGSGAGGAAGLAGGGEGILSGYYGLVQRLQTIRNTEVSLSSQELTLGLLEANFEAGLIDLVQVDEFRQNIETERANLLRARTQYQDAVESFLVSDLSLPAALKVELDDSVIRQFQLIDPSVTRLQQEATRITTVIGDLPESPSVERLRAVIRDMVSLAGQAHTGFAAVEAEHAQLVAEQDSRAAAMADATRRSEFLDSIKTVSNNLVVLRGRLDKIIEEINQVESDFSADNPAESANLFIERITELAGTIQEIGLVQATGRVQRVTIDSIDLSYEEALAIARANRLDWMNQRGALVDQWRLVAFNANRLLSDIDVEVAGNMGTVGDSASRFRGSTHNIAARISFDAPLNRKAERNLYRESLIDFQRSKRRYVGYVDRVTLGLRSRVRQIERLEENLEIQRRALVIAIRRVDKTLEDLNEPFPPAQPGQAAPQLGPLLAQNLLRALSDLRNTQDNFMSVWLNFEAARINLLFELGIIEIADDGTLLPVSLDQYRSSCRACEQTLADKDRPIDDYLDDLEDETAAGGDIPAMLDRQPDDQLVETVAMATGITIDQGEVLAEPAESSPSPTETVDDEKAGGSGLMRAVARRFGFDPLDEKLPVEKGDFPRTLRQFSDLIEDLPNDQAVAERTGWDVAAVQALRETIESATHPVLVSIPVHPPEAPELVLPIETVTAPATNAEVQQASASTSERDEPDPPADRPHQPPRLRRVQWLDVEIVPGEVADVESWESE